MNDYFNTQAEQQVLGALISRPNLFDKLPVDLIDEDFSLQNQRIFRAILNCVNNGKNLDIFLIAESLAETGSDDLDYLTDLASNVTGSNVAAYSELIIQASVNRKIFSVGQALQGMAGDVGSVEEKIANISEMVNLLERNKSESSPDFNLMLKSEIEEIDRKFRLGGKPTGLLTGFDSIDEMHCGWEPGDLIIMAGRPSMGKTTLAMNIAENIMHDGKNVLVFSLEMTSQMLTRRLISSSGSVKLNAIKTGDLKEDDWPKLELGVRKLKDKNIQIYDTPSMNVTAMASIARRDNRKKKIDLIIVDYLQLATGSSKDGRTNEISSISRAMKAMAKDIGAPVIAISQLSRKCEERADKRPMSSDLRESGQIEQDADFICFVYRDEVYREDSPSKGIAEIITSKNRNGETGTSHLASRLQFNRFFPLSKEYVPPVEEKNSGYRYQS